MAVVGCIGSDPGLSDDNPIPEEEIAEKEDEAWEEFERGVRKAKGDEEFGNDEYP